MAARKDAKVVKEIIKRYGNVLDLKSSPYLIVEIIRQYGSQLDITAVADCLPPGGPPPKKFDPGQLARELKARLADVSRLPRCWKRPPIQRRSELRRRQRQSELGRCF